ncbi:hypothetical protein TCAL_04123 [Tigriopus californicus]|uniref:Uncharacterized protein n=2 Tax=Tigriopus californicus TaxID=6832 RepID=A0A553NSE1_TIGCA|nr:ras-related protein Rab-13-like isoform X1 [Tigriopus californicus]XP_059086119.1 ras-related protein Rab-13-like isoform X1 [Tigriopus californicus]XP_059086129.1 ras-related protein Rab-13-like isoform X1 [Tigriopus californicus]TRY68353.1 hypothetical protein TCAL_04123 [Tigriopus californicus]
MDDVSAITRVQDDFRSVTMARNEEIPLNQPEDPSLQRCKSLNRYDHLYKLLVLGDTGVGKTSFIDRFTEGKFSDDEGYLPTIVINFKMRILHIKEKDKKIKLQIWDTSAKEQHAGLVENFLKGSRGFIFCYDVTNRESFLHLTKWFKFAKDKLSEYDSALKMICACKCDRNQNRQVTREEAHIFAISHSARYWETSAKSAQNVEASFTTLANSILAEDEGWEQEPRIRNSTTTPLNRASLIVRGMGKRVSAPKRSATTLRRSFRFSLRGKNCRKSGEPDEDPPQYRRHSSPSKDLSLDNESQGRKITCLGKQFRMPKKKAKCVIS